MTDGFWKSLHLEVLWPVLVTQVGFGINAWWNARRAKKDRKELLQKVDAGNMLAEKGNALTVQGNDLTVRGNHLTTQAIQAVHETKETIVQTVSGLTQPGTLPPFDPLRTTTMDVGGKWK